MTIRLCQALQAIGLATCGKGGARLAARLGMPTSRQTMLRRIMELPPITPPPVRDLGIDEFAFRELRLVRHDPGGPGAAPDH